MFSWFSRTTQQLKLIILKLETLYERSNSMTNELAKLKQEIEKNNDLNIKAIDLIHELSAELEHTKSELEKIKKENSEALPELISLVKDSNVLLENSLNIDIAKEIKLVEDTEVSVNDFIVPATSSTEETSNSSVYLP